MSGEAVVLFDLKTSFRLNQEAATDFDPLLWLYSVNL